MAPTSIPLAIRNFAHSEALRTDFSRAVRGTIGFMAPLIVAPYFHWSIEASFVALAAQNIAIVDVRGAYSLRLAVLLAMSIILAGYAVVGAFCAESLPLALISTAGLTLLSGLWRHLSSDYGPSLSISSLLMLFLAFAGSSGPAAAEQHAEAILVGGALGIFLQISFWPVRPQHPLRRTAAESWLAAADLFEALIPVDGMKVASRHEKVVDAENAMRAAVDKAALLLIQAGAKRSAPLLKRLEDLNLCAARIAVRVVALNTALEGSLSEESFARVAPALLPVLTALKNTARTIGLTVVSRHPSQLAAARVRLRRTAGLLHVLRNQIQQASSVSGYRAQLEDILEQIEQQLPEIGHALEATIERAQERAAFPIELFDVDTWMLKPLASTLNLRWKVEPALVRFIFRLAALTTFGVWVFKAWHLPHGYWLPFTAVVVLQPDFGATRQRAAQRVAGTVTGSLIASGLIWLQLGSEARLGAIALCVFCFAYILRRHYGVAIVFVTIFVVLLLEGAGPPSLGVVEERIGATLGGGLLAFIAAMIFWPFWERERLPSLLAEALRKNSAYLTAVLSHWHAGEKANPALIDCKRAAEGANNNAFSSLRRMFGDPSNQREGIERMAALANGNQRVTRLINLIFVQLTEGAPYSEIDVVSFARAAERVFESLAHSVEQRPVDYREITAAVNEMVERASGANLNADAERAWLAANLSRAATELSAMALIAEREASANLAGETKIAAKAAIA